MRDFLYTVDIKKKRMYDFSYRKFQLKSTRIYIFIKRSEQSIIRLNFAVINYRLFHCSIRKFLALAGNWMTIERIALSERLALSQWKFVRHETFSCHCSGIYAVKISQWPCRSRSKASRRWAQNELYACRCRCRCCFLIQGVRIKWRIAVPKTAARWTPRTRRIGEEFLKIIQS